MTQIRKNLITNVMCLIANVLVGLLYTPYLVKELGVVTYGVLPIALVEWIDLNFVKKRG